MRTLIALLLTLPAIGVAADRLSGTWQSDHDETMHFVEGHTLLEPRQTDFLDGLLGHLRLTFGGEQLRYNMPDADIKIQGKALHFVGVDESYRYRAIGEDEDSVALLVEKDHGRDRIIHIHFTSSNEFWLYSEESDYGLRDLNIREYFRRID